MATTGCDGVVVGRGCLGRPWLFGALDCALRGEPVPPEPPLAEALAVMRLHLRLLCAHLGEARAARDFRKHVGWYLTGFPVGRAQRRALVAISSADELDGLLDSLALDGGVDLSMRVPRVLPRGPVNGPRRVALPAGWLDDPDDPNPPAGAEEFTSGG
ncbi:MAG TPA: tRNA-dihydrouridine synthase, partial [Acidimicrobiales bacterium]|jgi:hypothetical protein|nr:tRNA-dihydrouridine synthase [Acidimicrobiales bacterium]